MSLFNGFLLLLIPIVGLGSFIYISWVAAIQEEVEEEVVPQTGHMIQQNYLKGSCYLLPCLSILLPLRDTENTLYEFIFDSGRLRILMQGQCQPAQGVNRQHVKVFLSWGDVFKSSSWGCNSIRGCPPIMQAPPLSTDDRATHYSLHLILRRHSHLLE